MAIPKRLRFEVLRRDKFRCRYCGAKSPDAELHVDHVIPRSRGGEDIAWNLTAACVPCNISKGDGIPSEELVREVRDDETKYQASKGFPVVGCKWCGKPIQHAPGDDEPIDCETCNAAVCEAWEAGRRGR